MENTEFIKNEIEIAENHQNQKEFTFSLNSPKDLEYQLQQLKSMREEVRDKHQKPSKRRYYNLAIMAKVDKSTTHDEVKRLLKHNTRTFFIDKQDYKSYEVEDLTKLIKEAAKEHQSENPNIKLAIGLTLQISGDACRIGRIRNNSSLDFIGGESMTLTTNMNYRHSSFKEILYVLNLQYYLPYVSLNDKVSIGHGVCGIVIKKLINAIVICVEKHGIVCSYDFVELQNQSDSLQLSSLYDMCVRDLKLAAKLQVDFISVPYTRYSNFLSCLQCEIKTNYKFKLIGCVDLGRPSSKTLDLLDTIQHLDYLWLTNLFISDHISNGHLLQDVFSVAKRLKKSIIGSIPLEHCNDFRLLQNHENLWKIDCMFIEKSEWCNKYPFIAQKLLPIKNYSSCISENTATVHISSNCQSMVNFVVRTISSIECQAIFLHTKCESAAIALSRTDIYCPVYIMLSLQESSEENNCLIELAKNLNLRRNLKPILYTKQMNECEYKPIDYGIEYLRQIELLKTGDFVITLEVGKVAQREGVQTAEIDFMVLMRAIYMPPLCIGEDFACI